MSFGGLVRAGARRRRERDRHDWYAPHAKPELNNPLRTPHDSLATEESNRFRVPRESLVGTAAFAAETGLKFAGEAKERLRIDHLGPASPPHRVITP